jgi:hypothetical protein
MARTLRAGSEWAETGLELGTVGVVAKVLLRANIETGMERIGP